MTPDNQNPRKRRRRRRRGQGGAPAPQGPQGVNGNGPSPGNEAAQPQQFRDGGGGDFGRGRRRRRSRRRGGGGGGPQMEREAPYIPPTDIPPGELTEVTGVLYVKPNGAGMLVKAENNFVPQQGDTIVPRGVIERLHLDPGLLIT